MSVLLLPLLVMLFSGSAHKAKETTVIGRIVMYDWALHDGMDDDIVVNKGTLEHPERMRIHFQQYYGFDSPAESKRIERLAFVGRGWKWKFRVRNPKSPEEIAACGARAVTPAQFIDESGQGEISRYMASPGGISLLDSTIRALPCMILIDERIEQASATKR